MCECYKVGGPWVAEDPNCPLHGIEAQSRQECEKDSKEELYQRILDLEETVNELRRRIYCLERRGYT